MVFLRGCYHQILGPRRHFPKFANGRCRHSDVWVRLDPHLSWQAPKSYVQRGKLLGLYRIRAPSPFVQDFCAARWDRPAKQRDEPAPSHSITWSARASNCTGTVRPSAFAVFRLTISSILVAN